ncbi:MAG TPA: hypothetical protein VFU49_05375 [Ktedonobacteraceae bacterium]|nr:hypothetical protein [Ktedonobacteraceae bacterium]
MALTFYTVLADRAGYPVKYCMPQHAESVFSYQRVQTFRRKEPPFANPAEASQEFRAWLGKNRVACYLEPPRFRTKVKALHQWRRNVERTRQSWGTELGPRMETLQPQSGTPRRKDRQS